MIDILKAIGEGAGRFSMGWTAAGKGEYPFIKIPPKPMSDKEKMEMALDLQKHQLELEKHRLDREDKETKHQLEGFKALEKHPKQQYEYGIKHGILDPDYPQPIKKKTLKDYRLEYFNTLSDAEKEKVIKLDLFGQQKPPPLTSEQKIAHKVNFFLIDLGLQIL